MGCRAIFSIYLLLCCIRYSVKTCRTSADRVGAKAVPSWPYPLCRRHFVFRMIFSGWKYFGVQAFSPHLTIHPVTRDILWCELAVLSNFSCIFNGNRAGWGKKNLKLEFLCIVVQIKSSDLLKKKWLIRFYQVFLICVLWVEIHCQACRTGREIVQNEISEEI